MVYFVHALGECVNVCFSKLQYSPKMYCYCCLKDYKKQHSKLNKTCNASFALQLKMSFNAYILWLNACRRPKPPTLSIAIRCTKPCAVERKIKVISVNKIHLSGLFTTIGPEIWPDICCFVLFGLSKGKVKTISTCKHDSLLKLRVKVYHGHRPI